jgi:GTP-binding protein
MRFLDYAPMVFVSAKTGLRVNKLLEMSKEAYLNSKKKIVTSELNSFLLKEAGVTRIGREGVRKSRVKYICQVGTSPPTFVVFLRGSDELHFSTVRFIINRIRERYGYYATPIRILQRPSKSKRKKA